MLEQSQSSVNTEGESCGSEEVTSSVSSAYLYLDRKNNQKTFSLQLPWKQIVSAFQINYDNDSQY